MVHVASLPLSLSPHGQVIFPVPQVGGVEEEKENENEKEGKEKNSICWPTLLSEGVWVKKVL